MATLHKATCKCKEMSEKDLVSAIEKSPAHWLHAILTICTAGIWAAAWIVFTVLSKLMPKYKCQLCNKDISKKQLRV